MNIPANPEPNTEHFGAINYIDPGEVFKVVYNEQILNPDGSLTVNAAHMYLMGNIAVGDLIIGQSVCGLSADGVSTAPPGITPDDTPTATTGQEASTVPTTEPPATTAPDDDEEITAHAAKSGSGNGNRPLVIGTLAAVCVLGLAELFAYKRRGAQPEQPPP